MKEMLVCLQLITGIIFLDGKDVPAAQRHCLTERKKRDAEAQQRIHILQQSVSESERRVRASVAFTVRLIDARDHTASVVRPITAALWRSRHDVDGRFSFEKNDISPEEYGLSIKRTSYAEDMMRSRQGCAGQKESLDVGCRH